MQNEIASSRRPLYFVLGVGLALVLISVGAWATRNARGENRTPTAVATFAAPTTYGGCIRAGRRAPVLAQGGRHRRFLRPPVHRWRDNRAIFGTCAQSLQMGELTPDEITRLISFRVRYGAVEALTQDNPGGPDNLRLSLRLDGTGNQAASEADQAVMLGWAQSVYDRLSAEVRRNEMVALARLDLAGRLGISADAILTDSVESVQWPDTCLGLGGVQLRHRGDARLSHLAASRRPRLPVPCRTPRHGARGQRAGDARAHRSARQYHGRANVDRRHADADDRRRRATPTPTAAPTRPPHRCLSTIGAASTGTTRPFRARR